MTSVWTIARMVWIESLRRKDAYVLGVVLLTMSVYLGGADVFGLGGATRYVFDLGLLAAWLFGFLFALPMAARQLPQEESRGTIYALLSKPVSRGALVVGKWLGVWGASVAATALLYGIVLAGAGLRGGAWPEAWTLAQAFALHAVALAVACALTLALSTRMTTGASATTAGVVIVSAMLMLPSVPRVAALSAPVRSYALLLLYHAFPHLGLFDLRQRVIHDWGPAPWPVAAGVALYGAVWTAALLGMAWWGYRRRVFRRGSAR